MKNSQNFLAGDGEKLWEFVFTAGYTIKYRNVYNRTKLNQQRYFMVNDKFMATQNAIAYGNKFSHFEYKWSVN